jgi:hypothetical protein
MNRTDKIKYEFGAAVGMLVCGARMQIVGIGGSESKAMKEIAEELRNCADVTEAMGIGLELSERNTQ